MNGWHVAWYWAVGDGGLSRHWAAGVGEEPLSPVANWRQNGVDVLAISNLAIGFPLFGNYKLSSVKG